MNILEIEKLTKNYKKFSLDNISFTLPEGAIMGLIGENGAGKSTLLKVLAGAYRPDSGEIHVFGEKAEIHNPADAMRYGIGCVYQELSFIPDLTVAENIL